MPGERLGLSGRGNVPICEGRWGPPHWWGHDDEAADAWTRAHQAHIRQAKPTRGERFADRDLIALGLLGRAAATG